MGAFADRVIGCRYRYGLGNIPVGGGEGEAGGIEAELCSCIQGNGDIPRGLNVQHYGIAICGSAFGDLGTAVCLLHERGENFAKVVVGANVAAGQHHALHHVKHWPSASNRAHRAGAMKVGIGQRAQMLQSVQIVGRLGFRDTIGAGTQSGEIVGAIQCGEHGCADRCTEIVGALQRQQHTGNARLTRILRAVIVVIGVNIARDTGRYEFAEVVARGVGVACQRQRRDHVAGRVVRGRAARASPHRVEAVQIACGLRFRDHVAARAQGTEGVFTAGVGGLR